MKQILDTFKIPISVQRDSIGSIVLKTPPALYDKLTKECQQVLNKIQDNISYKVNLKESPRKILKEIEDFAMIILISKSEKSKKIK